MPTFNTFNTTDLSLFLFGFFFFSDNKSIYSFELQHDFLTRRMLEMEGYFFLGNTWLRRDYFSFFLTLSRKKKITFELKYKLENVK